MRFALPAFLLAFAGLIAGCGGADRPAPAPAGVITSKEPDATPTPTVADVLVTIDDFAYAPRTLRIAEGTRVTWKNVDAANHTVTFSTGPGDLGNIGEGRSRSTRFTRAGTFTYVCEYHPSMRGKVIVK